MPHERSCLVVGAGMAGLTAARTLVDIGWDVAVLDKARRPGGRLATRDFGGVRFDSGAQFFTVRDSRFAQAVALLEKAGVVRPWFSGEGHIRYLGVGGMNAIAQHLSRTLNVVSNCQVEQIEPASDGWVVRARLVAGEEKVFSAACLILTPPVPQSLALCQRWTAALPTETLTALRLIVYDPCLALMARLDRPTKLAAPGWLRPGQSPIAWIADNALKGISDAPALTIHAQPDFSRTHWETPEKEVSALLFDAAAEWLAGPVAESKLHRWRYSQPVHPCAEPFLYVVHPAPVAFVGDGFGGSRVEGAFLAGLTGARRLAGLD